MLPQKKLILISYQDLRKIILISYKEPFYVESEDSWFLLYPSDNLSDKRLLCTPKMLDGVEREWFSQHLPVNSQATQA